MTSHPFTQIDVFGTEAVDGNPVAVVLDAEGITDQAMRRFSEWTNLSEVTYVLPPTTDEADYRVRIFSLSLELPFAGHPTLGTTRAWLEAGGVPKAPGTVVQECGIGLVPVDIEGDLLFFTAPPLLRSGPVDEGLQQQLVSILGADPEQVREIAWLDNGPGWVGVLLDTSEAVLALAPDASAFSGRPWTIGVMGLPPASASPDAAADLEIRAFFTDGTQPLREDPVTGSLNASAAQWLIGAGVLPSSYRAAQGTALGRRGWIEVRASDGTIRVGGRAQPVISGTVELD